MDLGASILKGALTKTDLSHIKFDEQLTNMYLDDVSASPPITPVETQPGRHR